MNTRSAALFLSTALGPLAGCVTTAPAHPPAYAERCTDPVHPCTFSYDFEPSGAAPDPFGPPGQFLVANEDAVLFRWDLRPGNIWDHDHVEYAANVASAIDKVEAMTSATCDGHPVLLLAANFSPSRTGKRTPVRERVVALVDRLDATPRVLDNVGAAILGLAEPGHSVKVEGLSLSPDCRSLSVGLRSRSPVGAAEHEGERYVREVHTLAMDVDWIGTRESALPASRWELTGQGCSGRPEGISDIAPLPEGGFLVLTSDEEETHPKAAPDDVARGRLNGTLWRRAADGTVARLACFPGHKPEALAVAADARSVRVICEDDDYNGRPIPAFAVRVDLP